MGTTLSKIDDLSTLDPKVAEQPVWTNHVRVVAIPSLMLSNCIHAEVSRGEEIQYE